MRFHVRKRRSAPAVIIVALIDVLIVLVVFLLVTTTFKQQTQLKLALPDSSQAKKSGANENPPLVVSVDAKGIYYIEKIARTLEQVRDELHTRTAQNPQLVGGREPPPLGLRRPVGPDCKVARRRRRGGHQVARGIYQR